MRSDPAQRPHAPSNKSPPLSPPPSSRRNWESVWGLLAQLFFLTLYTGGLAIFVTLSAPRVPWRDEPWHEVLILWILCTSLLSFLISSVSDPGIIRDAPSQRFHEPLSYPYDGILYHPKSCSTCQFVKPARSKHCSTCRACIARCDHHCIWINNCVGKGNHAYFLLFLTSTLVMVMYGALLHVRILTALMARSTLHHAMLRDTQAPSQLRLLKWYERWMYLALEHKCITGLCVFLAVVSVVFAPFVVHHVYTTCVRGMTTNESYKWSEVRVALCSGEVTHISARLVARNKALNEVCRRQGRLLDWRQNFVDDPEMEKFLWDDDDDDAVGGGEEEDYIVLSPKSQLENLYDIGIVGNVRDVLFGSWLIVQSLQDEKRASRPRPRNLNAVKNKTVNKGRKQS